MSLIDESQWHAAPPPLPRPKGNRSRWDPIVEELKQRPGQWADFPEEPPSSSDYLRGRYPDLSITTRDRHKSGGVKRCTLWLSWPVGVVDAGEG